MITPSFGLKATERVLPRLALDFTTASLDSRITLTRALNTATRVNSSGFIEVVNADLPRFDYDPITLACKGLLIEESRINLLLQSNTFEAANWTKSNGSLTDNATTSPNGTLDGDLYIPNVTSNRHRVIQTATVVTATSYTMSVYAKAGNYSKIALREDASTGNAASFDLSDGTVLVGGTAASIAPVGNGWYRCTFTSTSSGTSFTFGVQVLKPTYVAGNSITESWAGNGTDGVYLWGADLEAGAFPTSYIPTTTTAVTRNADVATMTGTNFSNFYNHLAGTWGISTDARSGAAVLTAGSFVLSADTTAQKKYAAAYTGDQSATSLVLGPGTIRELEYYPQALSSAEIQVVRSPAGYRSVIQAITSSVIK